MVVVCAIIKPFDLTSWIDICLQQSYILLLTSIEMRLLHSCHRKQLTSFFFSVRIVNYSANKLLRRLWTIVQATKTKKRQIAENIHV